MSRRVVITGAGALTSLGNSWQAIKTNILAKKTGVVLMADWEKLAGLNSHLAGPLPEFNLPSHYTRKQVRGMGRVAKLATVASESALQQANLLDQTALLNSGRMGIAYGSCFGSSAATTDLASLLTDQSTSKFTATTYIKAMSHTCAVNLSLFFGINGRIITTSSACTSGSQAIGYAYEAIKNGYQDLMLAGGAEELCPSQTAVFDTLYATSQKNDTPHLSPRPFDNDRDGLVIGEGACSLVLEDYEHAKARGATIIAEIVGFATNCDARHVTQPSADSMQIALNSALHNAGLTPDAIGYVNAHGTATERGDIAESQATYNVFADKAPISSLKSYFGHTLGACGALESWLSIEMMNHDLFFPTINLDQVDSACAPLDYITQESRELHCNAVMNNNFAFGGINTSLIFAKY